MTEIEFVKEISKLNIELSENQKQLLKVYALELQKYNEHTNLTTITDITNIYLKHFYDSLTLVKAVNFSSQKILDIGTGAGFPGLVIKIIFPNIKLTLLDSNNKKTTFLNYIINKLEITNVSIINKRAEDFIIGNRNIFDIVVTRAVAKLRILSELCLPFLKKEGIFIAMKSSYEIELSESLNTLKILNGELINIVECKLPIENSIRNLIIIKKNGDIDSKYPRSYNIILKKKL